MSDPSNVVTSEKEGLAKVTHEKYAYINNNYFVHRKSIEDCRLSVINEQFFDTYTAFVVPNEWPYKKYFDKVWVLFNNAFNKHTLPNNTSKDLELLEIEISLECIVDSFYYIS